MKIELQIQDPSDDAMLYCVDTITQAADGAKNGRAVFAFATVAGVDLLLQCDTIHRLINVGVLEIIVGIDAITNRPTLEKLREAARARPGLRPKVFWNSTAGIFHPKFCRFWNPTNETWIVGSGNLTPRGLRDNYEVLAVIEGRPSEFTALKETFQRFLEKHASDIRDIDDEALKRAAKNTYQQRIRDIEPPESHPIERQYGSLGGGKRVLIAELPKGGVRWQQANFDLATAREFFGIDPDSSSIHKNLFFNEIGSDGATIREEVRRFTFTRSRNLRVQLAAKNGRDYPTRARPITVFHEVKPRHFVYQLLLPGERGFATLKKLLDSRASGGVRRYITTIGVLRKKWLNCPFSARAQEQATI